MHQLTSSAQQFLKKNQGKKIVFTNGCFDILHVGHILYLKEARAQGDLLLVGVNSDDSVRRLKGEDRPINREQDRKLLLESLRFVDFVEIFSQETPLELIKLIRPAVLVKGGDWAPDKIVGHDFVKSYGGEVKSLLFQEGHSTTSLIEKIIHTK
ncbi:MAG: D-glycero-beta-D-manno-heptose 1-phosphate adenylyltransferase [Pseudomonadota bacterium]